MRPERALRPPGRFLAGASVHGSIGRVPRCFASIEIHIPAEVDIGEVTPDDLPKRDAPDRRASQSFGSRWYSEMHSAVLLVPSVPGSVWDATSSSTGITHRLERRSQRVWIRGDK